MLNGGYKLICESYGEMGYCCSFLPVDDIPHRILSHNSISEEDCSLLYIDIYYRDSEWFLFLTG